MWLSLKMLCSKVWHHLLVTATPWQALMEKRVNWVIINIAFIPKGRFIPSMSLGIKGRFHAMIPVLYLTNVLRHNVSY